MCELALTKAQSEKRKVKSAKRKAKARFNAPHLVLPYWPVDMIFVLFFYLVL